MAWSSLPVLVLALAACGGCGMTALKKQRLTQVEVSDRGETSPPSFATQPLNNDIHHTHYNFFSHHKTGTALSVEVGQFMAATLGLNRAHVIWTDVLSDSQNITGIPHAAFAYPPGTVPQGEDIICPGGQGNGMVVTYEDMRPVTLNRILSHCQPFRAVHFIRDLPEMQISNYVYEKSLNPGPGDTEPLYAQMRGPLYRSMNMSAGLAYDCEDFCGSYVWQMIELHEQIERDHLTDILEIRNEEVESDFNGTFTRIFQHFFGSDSSLVPNLLSGIQAFNTQTWTDEELDETNHVSNDLEKNKVRQEFWNRVAAGDNCTNTLVRLTKRLGYSGDRANDSFDVTLLEQEK